MTSQSAVIQQQIIHRYLIANGSAHTLELRESLGIMHPSGRIRELEKREGFELDRRRVTAIDSAGEKHSGVVLYSMPT